MLAHSISDGGLMRLEGAVVGTGSPAKVFGDDGELPKSATDLFATSVLVDENSALCWAPLGNAVSAPLSLWRRHDERRPTTTSDRRSFSLTA